jgi:hypothetical protein
MGKGGCLFAFSSWGARQVRGFIGCVILLFIAGPILIGFGCSFLFGGNYRDGNIAQYNAAIGNFTETTKPIILATNATVTNSYTVGSLPLAVSGAIPVVVQGNTDGVQFPNWYNDSYFTISNLVPTFTQTFYLTYNSVTGTPVSVVPPALTRSKSTSVSCSSKSGCSYSNMQSKCESAAPSSCSNRASVSGSCSGKCSRTCTWTEDIVDVCVVVRFVNGMWMPDPDKAFCSYPFYIPQYGVCFNGGTSRTLTYRLRSNDDPFIVLQYLTQGSGSFGLTEAQQRALGAGLVAVGVIIMTVMVTVAVLVVRSCCCPNFMNRSYVPMTYAPVAVVATNAVPETAAPLTDPMGYNPYEKPAADLPYPSPIQAV